MPAANRPQHILSATGCWRIRQNAGLTWTMASLTQGGGSWAQCPPTTRLLLRLLLLVLQLLRYVHHYHHCYIICYTWCFGVPYNSCVTLLTEMITIRFSASVFMLKCRSARHRIPLRCRAAADTALWPVSGWGQVKNNHQCCHQL